MSRENSPSISTDGTCAFRNTPGILTFRAATSSLSSVVLPGAYFLYHQHPPSLASV